MVLEVKRPSGGVGEGREVMNSCGAGGDPHVMRLNGAGGDLEVMRTRGERGGQFGRLGGAGGAGNWGLAPPESPRDVRLSSVGVRDPPSPATTVCQPPTP